MSHFDDPTFQAWLQQRDEIMMKAFNESIQDKATERTQMIQIEAQERYDHLVAKTSKLELAKDAALKNALERLSVLQAEVTKDQRNLVDHGLRDTTQRSASTTWAFALP